MPYKINNSVNGYSLGTENPFYKTEINTGIADMAKKYINQPLSRYVIQPNNNTLNIANSTQNETKTNQSKVANTFAEGMKVFGKNFINNLKYLGSSINKEASGDNYIKGAVNSLQDSFGGDILGQSNDVLRSKIKEIEDGAYQVPFPSMNPTQSLSLQQPLKMEDIVKKDVLKDIVAKRESGYTDAQINDWLRNIYDNGTEASVQHRKVLEEAENIPRTEGWGTVGNIAGGVLSAVPSIIGSALNPALGFALSGATLGSGLAQSIANSNKEIDLYEKNEDVSVPSWARKSYVTGAAAADLALDGLMQSQYLKHLNLPITGQLRKTLPNRLLNNTQAMHKYNDLFRHSVKKSLPGIMKDAGTLAAEQAAASGAASATRDLMSYTFKEPEHYPQLNEILGNALTEAAVGAGAGLVTGGVASGLGTLIKPHRSKRSFQPYSLNIPKQKSLFDTDGLSLRGYMDREDKIRQIIKDNYKSNSPKITGTPEYSLNLPQNPMFDLGDMSLREYNELVPQLRSALKDYYLPKPTQNEPNFPGEYKLNIPENPMFDLEGLSLRDWTERENRIKSILGENYQSKAFNLRTPYKITIPGNSIIDTDGLSLRGYMDREDKIRQIIKDNYKSNHPKETGTPEYSLNLPDNPMFDLGDMSLKEYNELVPQLRSALKDFYMQKPTQSEPNFPGEYKLNIPENPMIDLEGLSLRDWTERENRIRSILGENYQPPYHTLLYKGPINLQDKVRKLLLTEEDMKNVRTIPTVQYSNSLKRIATDDIAKSMNMKTRMFDDISSLPAEYKKYLDDHSRSKGFYNPETDEVVVIGNNIESEADLQNLFVQKGYSTKGLEGVLGKELDNLLDDVYNNMSNRDSAKYSDKGKTSRGTALSYISDLSKNPQMNPQEWNRLSSYVRELFKNKYNVKNLTDETIQNLLWRTGNQITGDDSIEEMIRKSAGVALLRSRNEYPYDNPYIDGAFRSNRMENIYKTFEYSPVNIGTDANNAYLYKNNDYGTFDILDKFKIDGNEDYIKSLEAAIKSGEIKSYLDYLNFISRLYGEK